MNITVPYFSGSHIAECTCKGGGKILPDIAQMFGNLSLQPIGAGKIYFFLKKAQILSIFPLTAKFHTLAESSNMRNPYYRIIFLTT